MKNTIAFFVLAICLALTARAQQDTPQLLKGPAGWAFERFALPPAFATDFPYRGAEELRFAPGMFKKDAPDYFTYAFVAELDSTTTISETEINNYLLVYFKGLCSSVAKDRKLVIDTSKITAVVHRKKDTPKKEIIYTALLNVFGVFADGAPVRLNAEVKVLANIAFKKTYLIFITSPQANSHAAWTELYKIQEDFVVPVN